MRNKGRTKRDTKGNMKPLIAYYGGKQRMASKLISLIPRHTVYVEPFCGGAALFFKKPWPPVTSNNHYREVINDTSKDLINLYRVMRHPRLGPKLVHQLELTPCSRTEHRRARNILKSSRGTPLLRAWAYYVQAQQSFSNTLFRGWSTGVYGKNGAASFQNKTCKVHEYLARMRSVYVENDDALAVIKRWDSPQTLFYCDPPYVDAHQGHYAGYTQDNLNDLIDTLDEIQGSFLLSGYDNDMYPDHWERFEFGRYCSADGKGNAGKGRDRSRAATKEELGNRKRTEIVLRVDRSGNARKEVHKIWEKWKDSGFEWGC